MINFLESTIFNKKRRIIKSMDYKYTETQADLKKLKSAMDFIRNSTNFNPNESNSIIKELQESVVTFVDLKETQ
jgi:hypothetical protein